MTGMKISSNFESGNIEVISVENPLDIRLNIRKDTNSDFMQWFYFRLQGAQDFPCLIHIMNAGSSFVPEGWEQYNVCASYDKKTWFRVQTDFDGEKMTIHHTPKRNSVYFAYFAPYSYEKHLELVHKAQESAECIVENLGETVEKRDIDMLMIGEPAETKKTIWVIARQHPGETMASWFMEGFVNRLLDPNDSVSLTLLKKAIFYVVPHMNIDGAIHGNLRVNSLGVNFNREWKEPSLEKSPEVFHVRNKMDQTGVDLFLDIHGDEALPYNFISGTAGIPGFTEKQARNMKIFLDHWLEVCPDFQTEKGYPEDKPGQANLNIASKHVAHRFSCLAFTLEMPFKDNKNILEPVYGWSPKRSEKLGESVLQAILKVIDSL